MPDKTNSSKPTTRGIIIAAAAILIGTGLYLALRDVAAPIRKVSVSGECLSTVAKDTTAVTLRFRAVNKNAAESNRLARASYDALVARVKNISDDTMKLNTTGFNSSEKREWSESEKKYVTIGTETSIDLDISSKNRATIETILGVAGDSKNTEIQGLRMFAAPETLKSALEDCIKSAAENARDKAAALASAGGGRVGKMMSAQFYRTTEDNNVRPVMMRAALYEESVAAKALAAPELFSSDSDISVTVNAEFEIR
ncbi:MAG: SIMPL domain-containing protein [Proteobacteria bacterium]|nr:SIMPL domain-containing protein [Pseudomonadota bacterium]